MIVIRPASIGDLSAITDIYNEAILTTTATFDTETKTLDEQRDWFHAHGPRHPILLSEFGGVAHGWAALSAWSPRRAYDETAEISVYVRASHRGRGLGGALVAAALQSGRAAGLYAVLARIADRNEASVRLHRSAGFFPVGVMREVGRKFGRRIDVLLMQRILADEPGNPPK